MSPRVPRVSGRLQAGGRRRAGGRWRAGGRRYAAILLSGALLVGGTTAAAVADDGSPGSATDSSAQDARKKKPDPTDPDSTSLPRLTPPDGTYLEGTAELAAAATVAGDSVTRLAVDDKAVDAKATHGVAHLTFDVGSNSTEARYHNYVLVNGDYRVDIPDLVNQRGSLDIPDEHLVKGENKVEIFAGTIESSCGTNYDDFLLTDIGLELLGEIADGEENEYSYSFGDGSCSSNPSYVTHATLSFFVQSDPKATTGLSADLDTTTLENGEHTVSATSAAGRTVTNHVTVNNAPAGAPALQPKDGTLVSGPQTVTAAAPAGDSGAGTKSLTVDGKQPVSRPGLGNGAATFGFDVGSNSIDDRYDNHLLVNGKRIDMGGTWVGQHVELALPARFLKPGDNTVTVVTSPYKESCGNNRDDFDLSAISLAFDGATVTGKDIADAYAMGDGSCGSSTTRLREAELHFDIDAPTVDVVDTLGSGNASLAFNVATNSIEARYGNHVLVNGQKLALDSDFVSRRVQLDFPNEWLVPGWNTVDMVTGTFATSCGANHDDFTVSDVVVTPVTGTATGRMLKGSYSMGDGNCGDNVNPLTEVDLEFYVDGPAQGLRADLDTTKIDDGKHTLAATSKTDRTATRVLVTDNSGPKVASSVPAAGQKLTASVVLDVRLDDMSGVVTGPDITLDGKAVKNGDPIGPGLSAGAHTLAVTGTDGLGNKATREVAFTSAGIPDAPAELSPASGTTGTGTDVKLSAKVAEPDGGVVDATFDEAEILTPNQVYQGTSTAVPTELTPDGGKFVPAKGLAPADGRTMDAPAGKDVTYQRFDVQVKGHVDHPVLRWEGTVDPERLASLRVWNTETEAWDVLTSARGTEEGETVLSAIVDPKYVDVEQVHAMVTGEDPFADDIAAGDPNSFADPDSYDFSIVHYTDTQYLSEGAVEQETPQERAVWESAYGDVMNWIKDNKDRRKISYVAHTGDIIENNIRKPADEATQNEVVGELQVSSRLQKVLDDTGIPNGVIAGNHDNQSGTENGPQSIYNRYYGPDRYQALSQGWEHGSYGGPWKPGDNQNHYDLFSAGGLDFVVVGLSYGVTREEAEWADSVFKRYPDRNGILLSHDYLAPSTNPDGRGAAFSAPDGSMLFKTVVQDNPNVFLILAGHEHGVGTNVKPKVGEIGHNVVELLADYQFYTVSADRLGLTEVGGYLPDDQLQFGAAFFRLLQFDVKRGEMAVDTYSPLLGEFGATEYDTLHRYDGREDNMVLPVDLSSRSTTFRTDAVALYNPVGVIGTARVDSGKTASVTWTGLKPGSTHAWFVTARSAGGGVTASAPSVFVTADARGGATVADPELAPWFAKDGRE